MQRNILQESEASEYLKNYSIDEIEAIENIIHRTITQYSASKTRVDSAGSDYFNKRFKLTSMELPEDKTKDVIKAQLINDIIKLHRSIVENRRRIKPVL